MSNNKKQFSVIREFNASKEKVFAAFSTAEALGKWWGPAGSTITVSSFDFKPKGKFHYQLDGNGPATMWGLFIFGNIQPTDLIEFVSSFSDPSGNIAKPPFDMDFPLEIFNRLTLTESKGKTTVTLEGHPINATEAQENVYYSISENMQQGFKGTFDQLEQYLDSSI
jgi:uncharacterized protein YndB with AHSA1/START domain